MAGATIGTVLRVLPRDPGAWAAVDLAVSTALVTLSGEPDVPPVVREAAPAWRRLSGPLREAQGRAAYPAGPCPDLCLAAVSPDDVEALGRLSRALGRATLPGAGPLRWAALARAAAAAGRTPGGLVVELARAHGLLDLDHGGDAEMLHVLAGVRTRRSTVREAHDRVAGRVAAMWAAGLA